MIFKHIVIGADSAGYALKEQIKAKLAADGYDVTDCGTDSDASCHYPVYGAAVARAVQAADAETCGILVCGTGVGMSMVANKFKGIRAACCSDTFSARMTRAHNDANILCFGAGVVGHTTAAECVKIWLETEVMGGNHPLRLEMIRQLEEKYAK